jgi:hypothetical protein
MLAGTWLIIKTLNAEDAEGAEEKRQRQFDDSLAPQSSY